VERTGSHVGGSQLIARRMAEQLGNAVHCNAPVRLISWQQTSVEVRQTTPHGGRSASLLPFLRRSPRGLSTRHTAARRDQLTQRLPQGSVIKCMLSTIALLVRGRPEWSIHQRQGPIKFTYDMSPPQHAGGDGRLPRRAGSRRWGAVSFEERRAMALDCFRRSLGHSIADSRLCR